MKAMAEASTVAARIRFVRTAGVFAGGRRSERCPDGASAEPGPAGPGTDSRIALRSMRASAVGPVRLAKNLFELRPERGIHLRHRDGQSEIDEAGDAVAGNPAGHDP